MTQREDGAVLLVVLVALALLAALAGVALRLGQSGVQGLAAERVEFSREVLTRSALAVLGARLTDTGDLPRDGTPTLLTLPGGQVEARVQAAEGLVNPGYARLPILQAVLEAEGGSPEQGLRLARAISDARQARALAGPADVAPLFAADLALWPKVAPLLTYLGKRSTVDPAVAPQVLRDALAGAGNAGVDLTQGVAQRGYFEIDLRVLAPGETLRTAKGLFSHVSVLRDRAGRFHLFSATWPQEPAG
jgi:hypothetical protein